MERVWKLSRAWHHGDRASGAQASVATRRGHSAESSACYAVMRGQEEGDRGQVSKLSELNGAAIHGLAMIRCGRGRNDVAGEFEQVAAIL